MKHILKYCAVVCFALWISPPLIAQDASHLEVHYTTTVAPTTSEAIETKLADAADKYLSHAPIPRIVLYDIAYPSDSLDFDNLWGNALLLITAIVQDSGEYPFGKVRVESPTDTTTLSLLFDVRSQVSKKNANVRTVFGKHRVDAFYLFPMNLKKSGNELKLDFNVHRDDFRIDTFDEGIPEGVYTSTRPRALSRNDGRILRFIEREYPDLAKILSRQ